jgi:hypothetical protein
MFEQRKITGLDPANWTTVAEQLDKICPLQNLHPNRQTKSVENKTSNDNSENEIPRQEHVTRSNANTRENTSHTNRR